MHTAQFINCSFKTFILESKDRGILFQNCEFLDACYFIVDDTISNNGYVLYNDCIFSKYAFMRYPKEIVHISMPEIRFANCTIEKNFSLDSLVSKCDFMGTTFKGKVEMKNLHLEEVNFRNTKFEKLADFYQTVFEKVNFEKTDFNDISVFTEATFEDNVDFKYTKFIGNAIFRKTIFKKKFNLCDSIFGKEANFLGISAEKGAETAIKVENRETARIIKNSFDKTGNIIEANKFYALEMEARKKELNRNKNPLEWLVFWVHSLSSNHSQDWFLALLWIVAITSICTQFHLLEIHNFNALLVFSTIIATILASKACAHAKSVSEFHQVVIASLLIVILFFGIDSSFECFIYNLNFFSVFNNDSCIKSRCGIQSGGLLAFIAFGYRLTIAYLTYQFIISIRQNTRRK